MLYLLGTDKPTGTVDAFGASITDSFPAELQSTGLANRIWPVDRYPDENKNEEEEKYFSSSVAKLMTDSSQYFTDDNIWEFENDELMELQKTESRDSIRYNFDKRAGLSGPPVHKRRGPVRGTDFSVRIFGPVRTTLQKAIFRCYYRK